VLVSVVAGALRSYLIDQGDSAQDVEIRALVPVNLRPSGPVRELGNYFGMVFLSLPVGIEDPLERLAEVRRRMQDLKTSTQPLVALAILTFMGIASRGMQERVLEILAANASMALTNVPGPGGPLYFAGARITQQIFWVPQSGGIGMGISVLTYAGGVQFGVIADIRRVPYPQEIVQRFAPEFEALLLATLMQPWGPD
jgi:diacylglycerol O-acyltransferase